MTRVLPFPEPIKVRAASSLEKLLHIDSSRAVAGALRFSLVLSST